MPLKLPYFDMIFSRLAVGDPEFEEAFQRHVHFGAWEDLENAYTDQPDSIRAMERLCLHLISLAEIGPGQDVLDVGCGFGGTLACLNEQFSPLRMTGLNIDSRQLEVARKRVAANSANTIEFVQGDACEMSFPEQSFDRVTAVECIFHFPSREKFFQHVGKVLRPGGNLTLTDFLQPEGTPDGLWDSQDDALWGPQTAIDLEGYRELAAGAGLTLTHAADITRNVRPTYHWFGNLLGRHFPEIRKVIEESQFIVDAGGMGYCTLRFDKV